ncbi:MAG: sulfotransferase [Sphingomicrobium sp.]
MDVRNDDAVAAFQRGDIDQARRLTQAQLATEPGSARLQHLLGLIECRCGRVAEGVEWLRKASDAEPDNIAFRVMLARALVDAGKADEALDVANPKSATSPAELALWHARAEAADRAERFDVAADAWRVLALAREGDWRAWANSGEALGRLERWPDAAAALRRAWDLNGVDRPLQQKYASALAWAGQYEESADHLRQMLDAGPEDVGIRLTLARLYADLGLNKERIEQLDKAAKYAVGDSSSADSNTGLIRIALPDHDPSKPVSEEGIKAVRELALLLERTSRMEALRNLLLDAEKLDIPPERLGYPAAAAAIKDGDPIEAKRLLDFESDQSDPVRRHRLTAKINDMLGDYGAAFTAADAMNRAMPDFDRWVREGAEHRRLLRAYEQRVTRDWAIRLRPLAPDKRRAPAFLVGFPRSGTTLLDTFLMGHPETKVLEEFHMIGAAEKVLGNVTDLPTRSVAQLEDGRRAYFAELDRHADPSFAGLIVDKLPLNMLALPMIYSLFPEARVIFAQRHPCDAVLSCFMQSFTLNHAMACFLTLDGAADLYDVAMGVFMRSRGLLPLAVHTLVYEELISEPEEALRPLIEFLGLEWRSELLDHRATAKSRGAIGTPSYDQVTEPLSKAPSGRWRRYEEQLEPVLPVLLPWAQRLGYSD